MRVFLLELRQVVACAETDRLCTHVSTTDMCCSALRALFDIHLTSRRLTMRHKVLRLMPRLRAASDRFQ